MISPCKHSSTIRGVDFQLLYQHFFDNGFELLFEHKIKKSTHQIMFNKKYSILCNLESYIEWDGKVGFNDCYLIFELNRKRDNCLYDNGRQYKNLKYVYGSYDTTKFESCYVNYNWRVDLTYHRSSLNEIINDFENEGVFKSKWESNRHNLEIGFGLCDYTNSKDLIKLFIEKIDNKSIKTFLLNYYNENNK